MNFGHWSSTLCLLLVAGIAMTGCQEKRPQYGVEVSLALASDRGEVWAIAPAINLSGQADVDPLLQADIAYQQLQHVRGLTVVPVNRVAEVYAHLQIEKVQSIEQAVLVCDLLGCEALLVPTVTAYDPYNPPKFGAALQVFRRSGSYSRPQQIDPRRAMLEPRWQEAGVHDRRPTRRRRQSGSAGRLDRRCRWVP